MSERRHSIRHGLRWQTVIHGNDVGGEHFDELGVIENISSTGAFFYINRRVQIGSQLDLAIKLPFKKESWMKYTARVIRVEEQPAKTGVAVTIAENNDEKIGIAIQFDHIKPIFVCQ